VTFLAAGADPDSAAWARWLNDVMTSWPAQLAILLLWVCLGVLLARHARREWDGGLRNRYLLALLGFGGAFLALQFVLSSGLVAGITWPAWLFVIEFVFGFALALYAFVRWSTRQRSGSGTDEARSRGAALERTIGGGSGRA